MALEGSYKGLSGLEFGIIFASFGLEGVWGAGGGGVGGFRIVTFQGYGMPRNFL